MKDEQIEAIIKSVSYGDGWDGDMWDRALVVAAWNAAKNSSAEELRTAAWDSLLIHALARQQRRQLRKGFIELHDEVFRLQQALARTPQAAPASQEAAHKAAEPVDRSEAVLLRRLASFVERSTPAPDGLRLDLMAAAAALRRMANVAELAPPAHQGDAAEPAPIASIRWMYDGRHEVMWHVTRPPSGWVSVFSAPPAEPAPLSQDAKRLDWIEAQLEEDGAVWLLPSGEECFVQVRTPDECRNYPVVAGMRAAIDAAIASKGDGS